jgi:hypothetical protein
MADLSVLLQSLLAADKQAAEDDPFLPLANFGNQMGDLVVQASPRGSVKENLLAGLITGLTGGIAQNLGQGYRDRQGVLARDVLFNELEGSPITERPRGMSPSVFSGLRNTGSIFSLAQNLANESEAVKAQRDFKNTIATEVVKSALDNPHKAQRAQAVLEQLFGNAAPVARAAEQIGTNADGSPIMTEGAEPVAMPVSELDPYLDRFGGDEAAARNALEYDRGKPDRIKATEDTLRSQFLGQKVVQDYAQIATQFEAMRRAVDDTSAVSDFDFTFGTMKILDPGSIVRETEQGLVVDSQSMPTSLLNQINKKLEGKSQLGPEIRRDLINLAQRRFEIQKQSVDALAGEYRQMATTRGANPDYVAVVPGPRIDTAPAPAATPTQPAQATPIGATKQIQGKTYIKAEDGLWHAAPQAAPPSSVPVLPTGNGFLGK